jgi:hypothetical protein
MMRISRFLETEEQCHQKTEKRQIKWQRKKLEICNNDPGKLWKNILGWLNWCSSGSPTKLYHAGQIVTSPARLADIMNNFFVNKIATIQGGLPHPTDDPLRTFQNMMKDRTAVFSLSAVHPDTVKKIILDLKTDNIDTYTIKLMVEEILPAVTHILNLSIQQATFP